MGFCENCGSKIKETDPFCSGCGAENENFVPQKGTSTGNKKEKYIPKSYEQARHAGEQGLRQPEHRDQHMYHRDLKDQLSAPIRSWGLWLLAAIGLAIVGSTILYPNDEIYVIFNYFAFPFGIVYAIYIYQNFTDFQTHLTNVHASGEYTPKSLFSPLVGALIVVIAVPLKLSADYYDISDSLLFNYVLLNSPVLILIFIKNKMLYEHLEEQGEVERGSSAVEAVLITLFTFIVGALFVDWRWQHTFNKHIKRTEGFTA